MGILTVFRIEWRRIWRNKLTRAGMLVGLIIPLLYSFLYLWAFWDPYGSLDKLPVALVNADSGGTLSGEHVNYGQNLITNLQHDKQLDWHVVGPNEADSGVSNGTYFAVLKVPKNFTKDILSVDGTHAKKAQLIFIPNQGTNYLAGNIVARVQDDVAASLNRQFSQKFITRLLDVVGKESGGLSSAAKQAGKLASGSTAVANGTTQLETGVNSADAGAHKLAAALTKMSTGSGQLADGLSAAATGTKKVAQGVTQTGQGVSQVNSKLSQAQAAAANLTGGLKKAASSGARLQQASNQLQSGSTQAHQGANSIAAGLQQATSASQQIETGVGGALQLLANSAANQDPAVQKALGALHQVYPGTQKLTGSLQQLQTGSANLANSLQTIEKGQQQLTGGLSQLSTKLGSAAKGSDQIATGLGQAQQALTQVQSALSQSGAALDKLASAQSQLHSGADTLTTSAEAAQTGAAKLATGLDKASQGSKDLTTATGKLASGASTFAHKLNSVQLSSIPNKTEKAKLMSNPVTIKSLAINPVTKYGPGLTPYFLPLSLWVGALMLYFIMSLREGRWSITPVSNTSVLIGKFALLWTIAAAQAVIAASALLFGLGLTVTSTLGFYLYAILMAITYVTVIGMLLSLLGTGPGRVLAIVLLLLQLTSSGGTFPIQLVPHFFQAVHPWLPMSYAVTGLRRLIAFHNLSTAWHTAEMTGIYLGTSLLVLVLRNLKRISPAELQIPDRLVS
ncbi:YhgE/Pip domain-containing protein [Alicyclobacillus sp. SO9]|uniref:YhgE/Pip domain-containing protein n=1 Tax=Alicyclobacillus sp. SO9 TaxID=2665646 RepID=UPI0018E8CC1A|nr:YhgE/Pip domain-containing protein [Alicyclobacillus sp. SO9]QQE79354.1 YhgE/Pip domain-containing protein [Alicyclobacillus sp. SO9]